jgi:hypothetical protein
MGQSRHAPAGIIPAARITESRIAAMRTGAHSYASQPAALSRVAASNAVPPLPDRGRDERKGRRPPSGLALDAARHDGGYAQRNNCLAVALFLSTLLVDGEAYGT